MATQKVDFDVLAHDKASDKLDRISRAFRKLANDADGVDRSKGLDSLSKQLRNVANDFEKEGDRAGKGFGSSLKKWLTGSGADLGKQGGTVFGSGFLGALKTPVLGPALVAVLGGAVATAAPAVGAIAGTGIVTGFGLGLAGLGLVFASKSEAVQKKWTSTLDSMGADMRVLSRPFESTLTSMADVARRTFDGFKPDLDAAFARLAPSVAELGDDLGRAVEELAPAVQPLAEAFTEVAKTLGPATQGAIRNVSEGLQDLAASVKENPDALADTVKGIGDLSRTLLQGVTALNQINGAIEDFTGGFSGVDAVFAGANFAVSGLFAPFTQLANLLKVVRSDTRDMNSEVQISSDTMKLWTQGLSASQLAAAGTGAALDPLPAKVESLAAKFDRQWQATQKANDALVRQSNLLLTLSGSQIAFQAAIDAASASIKENGRTHDINTEKGRRNKTALDEVARSAAAQTTAMRDAGDGNVAAARHAEGAQRSFIKLATQMGYTVPEAKRMAESLIKIPNVTRTAKLNANKKDLEQKLAAAKKELASKDLTKERRAQLNATIKKLEDGIARAKSLLAGVPPSKTVTITTRLVTERIARTVSGPAGGHVPAEKRASGGPVKKGVPYIVGEEGPEPFIPDQDGVILPNSSFKRGGATPLAYAAQAPQPIVVQFLLDGRVVQQSLLKLKSSNGGMELGLA